MINLFDNYNQESIDLHKSLQNANINNKTIVINYNGFLEDDVESPYSYFINAKNEEEKPLYFNKLKIPDFYEIDANNEFATIYDFTKIRGKINYISPKYKRLVKNVEWYDDNGNLRIIDHYDKYGKKYAQDTYNLLKERINTTYYNSNNEEIIVENYITNDIILNTKDKEIKIFKSQLEFLEYYLDIVNLKEENILFNTLANSFFASLRKQNNGEDILVWQEDIYDDLPGNMKFILENNTRVKKILVANKNVYEKIINIVSDKDKERFEYLGYIYSFKKENNASNQILILTNSDEIEQVEYILNNCKNSWFHIAAVTEMSQKLMSLLQTTKNLTLYPNISAKKVKELYSICDYYLDINYGTELMNAVREAFENQMIILAFDKTVHNNYFIDKKNIYNINDANSLIEKINISQKDKLYIKNILLEQRIYANEVSKENYKKLLLE